jgi:hypothetical protein
MNGAQSDQSVQVVGLRGAVQAPVLGVQCRHGRGKPDLVPQAAQDGLGCASPPLFDQPLDVVRIVIHLVGIPNRQPLGQRSQALNRPLLGHPLDDLRRQRPGGPAGGEADLGRP